MKFNLNNPAFLQMAGNSTFSMRMTTSVENQEFFELSANGVVYIDSVKNGVKVRKTLVSPDEEFVAIENDANTEIVILGEVTVLNASDDGNTGLTSIDVSKNPALTELNFGGCTSLISLNVQNPALAELSCTKTGLTSIDLSKTPALTEFYCNYTRLTSLDVSKNTELTYLALKNCTELILLDIQNTELLADGYLFVDLGTNLTTLRVAGTSDWAYEQVENWLSGDAPNDGTILVDENTPQDVIDAATDKGWTVEYVDA